MTHHQFQNYLSTTSNDDEACPPIIKFPFNKFVILFSFSGQFHNTNFPFFLAFFLLKGHEFLIFLFFLVTLDLTKKHASNLKGTNTSTHPQKKDLNP